MTTTEGKRAEAKFLKHRYDNRRLTDDERERAGFTCQYKRDGYPVDGYFGLKCEPYTVYEVTARCTQYWEAWKVTTAVREWEPCYRQGKQHFEFLCPRCLKFHKIKQQIRTLA